MHLKPRKIALVLGSGGARGWAHIGVVKAVRESGIPIHCIVGTSMGALVGAAMATDGMEDLEEVARCLDWKQVLYYFLDISFPRSGLIDGSRIVDFISTAIQTQQIENLPIEFRAVATDIVTGEECVIGSGDLVEAVRASISVAGIFTPVERGESILVDGGVVNPLPVRVARELGADFIIASEANLLACRYRLREAARRPVNEAQLSAVETEGSGKVLVDQIRDRLSMWDPAKLDPIKRWLARDRGPNIFEVMGGARRISHAQLTLSNLKTSMPNVLIQAPVEEIEFMDYHKASDCIAAGYAEARKTLSNLSAFTRWRLG